MRNGGYIVALAGNPNVGKSTIFNALTGLNRHTGNWTGKTVDLDSGRAKIKNSIFEITDLPGTYSLNSYSNEERIARDYLLSGVPDCVIVTLDSNKIERNLCFALEVLAINQRTVICLNLSDEAEKNGVFIDSEKLSERLGAPVIKTSAVKKQGLKELKSAVYEICRQEKNSVNTKEYDSRVLKLLSRQICSECVTKSDKNTVDIRTERLDGLLTSKVFGIPVMLCLFGLLFWITAVGANYPSELLSKMFEQIKQWFYYIFELLNAPGFITGLMIDGIYTTLSWVVSVMLPPMAIFFPLFSLIEDSGYLPRIAFNLDRFFGKSGAHGKQSLTMAMGLGCNACGVTGCRIIEGKKERLIAVLTNNFMPCNGRFPILIALISIFFTRLNAVLGAVLTAAILVLIIFFCSVITLLVSKILSKTLRTDGESGFIMELPPYRKPQIINTLTRSFLDRTLYVVGRAMIAAAPAGAVIWLCANLNLGDSSLLSCITAFLDPFGKLIGLDGVTVTSFVLGFPANETVIPIMIMAYNSTGVMSDYTGYGELYNILSQNGWTSVTAVCMMVMTICHFPCATTCLTIKKETGSVLYTLLSVFVPTIIGLIICFCINLISFLFS